MSDPIISTPTTNQIPTQPAPAGEYRPPPTGLNAFTRIELLGLVDGLRRIVVSVQGTGDSPAAAELDVARQVIDRIRSIVTR